LSEPEGRQKARPLSLSSSLCTFDPKTNAKARLRRPANTHWAKGKRDTGKEFRLGTKEE
jgi:hypothetical protein